MVAEKELRSDPSHANAPEVIFTFSPLTGTLETFRVMADERGSPKLVEKPSNGTLVERISTGEF
jgi:hypothetical protein